MCHATDIIVVPIDVLVSQVILSQAPVQLYLVKAKYASNFFGWLAKRICKSGFLIFKRRTFKLYVAVVVLCARAISSK